MWPLLNTLLLAISKPFPQPKYKQVLVRRDVGDEAAPWADR
jgi:hypothetical protein